MKKLFSALLLTTLLSVSAFAQDTKEEKDDVGMSVGFEFRTGDVLNGYQDGYTPGFYTYLGYAHNFADQGMDWWSIDIGFGFELKNIGKYADIRPKGADPIEQAALDAMYPAGAGAIVDSSSLESWLGMTFDLYKGLYFNTTFNTNDWMGFYLGWGDTWGKHSFNIQAGTAVLWNPNAGVVDTGTLKEHVYENYLYHLDTPFELGLNYSYQVNDIFAIDTTLTYTIPYIHNPDIVTVYDKDGHESDFTNIHRIEPGIGFTAGMMNLMLSVRMEYHGTNLVYSSDEDGTKGGLFTVEPRLALGINF